MKLIDSSVLLKRCFNATKMQLRLIDPWVRFRLQLITRFGTFFKVAIKTYRLLKCGRWTRGETLLLSGDLEVDGRWKWDDQSRMWSVLVTIMWSSRQVLIGCAEWRPITTRRDATASNCQLWVVELLEAAPNALQMQTKGFKTSNQGAATSPLQYSKDYLIGAIQGAE